MMVDHYPPLEHRKLPKPPHWSKAIGVGIVVMGLGIGTGELILWPHLITKHGLSLLWLALLGIAFQYFINKEVARHQVATGESFFTTSARAISWSVFFWLFSAIILYIWPGWASAIGTTLRELFGFGTHLAWSSAALILVLLLTYSGRVAYTILEWALKITVPSFFTLLLIISFFNLTTTHLLEALRGVFSFGIIPADVDVKVLLGAIVFAGAGGMLNLTVSLWYRDKQVGMGKYFGRIVNPVTGKEEAIVATGFKFDTEDHENMVHWRSWMRYVNVDQGVIFFALGFTTLFLLAVNAHAVLTPKGLIPEGLDVAVVQATIFGDIWGPPGFKLFLVMAFLMLFSVMWTVIDALSRMVTDMLYTNARAGKYQHVFSVFKQMSAGTLYYGTITMVVALGLLLIHLEQPLTLLVISGALSGVSMTLYVPFLIYLNNVKLPKPLRPSLFTNIVMAGISVFFAYFSYFVVVDAITKLL